MRVLWFLLLLIFTAQVHGQTWTPHAAEFGISHQVATSAEYGAGVSFYDVNNDGWDDLTFCQSFDDIKLYLNTQTGFEGPIDVIPNSEEAKQVTWVDYDNDGDPDLFVTRRNASFVLYQNDGEMNFIDVSASAGFPETNILTFGNSWGDYDRDGWLDVYICNYNNNTYSNFLFHNNGDGTFSDVTQALNVGDGFNHSFQPNFIDVNNDMWPDLFIANDRENSSNTLYINQGGSFVETTIAANLDDYFFSMNNTAADFDHDGDLDIYVSNNPFGNKFYVNDGTGVFSEQAEQAGIAVFDHSWSAQWVDYDNNTWEDLHVCCSPFWNQPGQNRFFENLGTGSFTEATYTSGLAEDDGWAHSSAVGDYNQDGFPDLIVVNDLPDWSELYASTPNENGFVKILLEGTVSNRDGIGSWIDLYSNNIHQRKFTHCGEGYLSQNSRTEHFGLGNATIIDSIVISWPSGFHDVWYNIPINSTLHLVEGTSVLLSVEAESTHLCSNDSILLTANLNDDSPVLWSNGNSGVTTYITEPGDYYFQITNEFEITSYSDTISILEATPFSVAFSTDPTECSHLEGGSVIAEISGEIEITEIAWNNQITNQLELTDAPMGWHQFSLINEEGCTYSDSIFLNEPDSLLFDYVVNHPSCSLYGSVESNISGGAGGYVIDWGGLNPESTLGGDYPVTIQDMEGCTLDTIITVNMGAPALSGTIVFNNANGGANGSAQLNLNGGTPPYSIEWQPIGVFDIMTVYELAQGSYTVEIEDSLGCTYSISFSILDLSVESIRNANITVFPNPFSDKLNIKSPEMGLCSLKIFNNTGQLIFQEKVNSTFHELDTSSLPAGIYTVSFHTLDGQFLSRSTLTKN